MVRDMGRLAAGELELQVAPVRLEPIVAEAVEIVALEAREAGVDIRAVTAGEIVVRASRDRLRQVLVHLLDNAIKYSAMGTQVSVLAAAEDAQSPRWVEIRVTDDGPGIPADQLETVFEPYRRLPGTATLKPGVGLGLSLGRALVELMGGTLIAESAERGASFLVRLPRAGPREPKDSAEL